MRKRLASVAAGVALIAATTVPLAAPAHAQQLTHTCSYTYQGQTYTYHATLEPQHVELLARVGVSCRPFSG